MLVTAVLIGVKATALVDMKLALDRHHEVQELIELLQANGATPSVEDTIDQVRQQAPGPPAHSGVHVLHHRS